jgi:hypothetical protein
VAARKQILLTKWDEGLDMEFLRDSLSRKRIGAITCATGRWFSWRPSRSLGDQCVQKLLIAKFAKEFAQPSQRSNGEPRDP